MTNLGICARHGGDLLPPGAEYEPRFGSAMAALADLDYSRGRHRSARAYLDRFKVAQPTPQVLLLAVRVERKLGAYKRADT